MATSFDPGLHREIDQEVDRQIQGAEEMLAEGPAFCAEPLDAEPRTEASDPVALPDGVNRRQFMRTSAAVVSSAAIAGTLQLFHARKASASHRRHYKTRCPYGDPEPTVDQSTGLKLIGLPLASVTGLLVGPAIRSSSTSREARRLRRSMTEWRY